MIYGISEQLTLQAVKQELNPQFKECKCVFLTFAPLLTPFRPYLSILLSQVNTPCVKVTKFC